MEYTKNELYKALFGKVDPKNAKKDFSMQVIVEFLENDLNKKLSEESMKLFEKEVYNIDEIHLLIQSIRKIEGICENCVFCYNTMDDANKKHDRFFCLKFNTVRQWNDTCLGKPSLWKYYENYELILQDNEELIAQEKHSFIIEKEKMYADFRHRLTNLYNLINPMFSPSNTINPLADLSKEKEFLKIPYHDLEAIYLTILGYIHEITEKYDSIVREMEDLGIE